MEFFYFIVFNKQFMIGFVISELILFFDVVILLVKVNFLLKYCLRIIIDDIKVKLELIFQIKLQVIYILFIFCMKDVRNNFRIDNNVLVKDIIWYLKWLYRVFVMGLKKKFKFIVIVLIYVVGKKKNDVLFF